MTDNKIENEDVAEAPASPSSEPDQSNGNKAKTPSVLFRLLLFAVPILIGAAGLFIAIRNQKTPALKPEIERSQNVRVLTIVPVDFTPTATGNGMSKPERIWDAVAEVKGKIATVHPTLKAGGKVEADTVLLTIDDQDIRLAIARLQAEISRSNATIAELNASRENYEATSSLDQKTLALAEKEFARIQRLKGQNAVSASEAEAQQKTVLAQRQQVQATQNKLNLLPAQVQSAEANLQVATANLKERQRDLERCVIKSPIGGRVGDVSLDVGETLSAGQRLFSVQPNGKLEIEAQIATSALRRVFDSRQRNLDASNGLADRDAEFSRYFNQKVLIRYELGGQVNRRFGRVVRFREQLSDRTRSGRVVIAFDEDLAAENENIAQNRSGSPPPVPGTYCEIEMRGKTLPERVVIPVDAIRDENVFVVSNNRLKRKTIEIEMTEGQFAIVKSGLQAGDKLVVSEPETAIDGVLVRLEEDSKWSELIGSLSAKDAGFGEINQ